VEVRKLEEAIDTSMHVCSLLLFESSSASLPLFSFPSFALFQHPCFFGSGQIEVDDYIGMVASHFLQRRQKYVSIAHGGYEGRSPKFIFHSNTPALHCLLDTLAMTASVLDSHTPAACVVCQAQEPRAKAAGKESKGDSKAASKGEAKDAGPASAPVAESKKESKKESKGSNSPRVSRAQSEEAGGAAGAAEAAPSAMAVKLSTWAAAWKVLLSG
jgi:hypothetical protein